MSGDLRAVGICILQATLLIKSGEGHMFVDLVGVSVIESERGSKANVSSVMVSSGSCTLMKSPGHTVME